MSRIVRVELTPAQAKAVEQACNLLEACHDDELAEYGVNRGALDRGWSRLTAAMSDANVQ